MAQRHWLEANASQAMDVNVPGLEAFVRRTEGSERRRCAASADLGSGSNSSLVSIVVSVVFETWS